MTEEVKGRAPWYSSRGKPLKPFMIGVAGGTASGKTTVCQRIIQKLNVPWVIILSTDRYYRTLSAEERANVANYNFDLPGAIDWNEFRDNVKALAQGHSITVPVYDFKTHSRSAKCDRIAGADVVLIEGLWALYSKEIREYLDFKIFVDADSDIRLARRLRRDVAERGRTVDSVLHQYFATVKPAYEEFIAPSKRYADIIIPGEMDNSVAIDLMVQHIRAKMTERDIKLKKDNPSTLPSALSVPENLVVMPSTASIKLLHTTIRDKTSSNDDFVDATNRLASALANAAFEFWPSRAKVVDTPTNAQFVGAEFETNLYVVSIVRAGDPIANVVRKLVPGAALGKIVITQNAEGPRLYFSKIPEQDRNVTVLLVDAVVGSGQAMNMALHLLIDHGFSLESIIVACFTATPQGLHLLAESFPKLRIVTTALEQGLSPDGFATPGVGAFVVNTLNTLSMSAIFILPTETVKHQLNHFTAGNKPLKLISLPFPPTGAQTRCIITNGSLVELQRFHDGPSCWFIGNTVEPDGAFTLGTRVDPLFVALSAMWSLAGKEQGKVFYKKLDELLGESKTLALMECSGFEQSLSCICDVKTMLDDTVYRLNEEKILSWLKGKVEALVPHFTDSLTDAEGARKSALCVLSEYVNEYWLNKLLAEYNINASALVEKKRAAYEGVEVVSGDNEATIKRKTADSSASSSSLSKPTKSAKLDGKGMMKLSSYFTKAPKT